MQAGKRGGGLGEERVQAREERVQGGEKRVQAGEREGALGQGEEGSGYRAGSRYPQIGLLPMLCNRTRLL